MNMPLESLIARLITEGGALVSSNACSELEIADAKTTDRFHVNDDGFGFVLRSQQWLDLNKARELAHPNTVGQYSHLRPNFQNTKGPDPRSGAKGWAPGNYLCSCRTCRCYFTGDKRATMCADCAYS